MNYQVAEKVEVRVVRSFSSALRSLFSFSGTGFNRRHFSSLLDHFGLYS
jgi:hypothetical protein